MQSTGAETQAEVQTCWFTALPDLRLVAKDVTEDTANPTSFEVTPSSAKSGALMTFDAVLIVAGDDTGYSLRELGTLTPRIS